MTFADLNIEVFFRADRFSSLVAPRLNLYHTLDTMGWCEARTFGELVINWCEARTFGELNLG